MAKLGKRTRAAREAFAGKDNLSVEEAVALVKKNASAKFDESVEIAMNLGVDPRHADQMVRGVVNLPNGTGRSVRVAVFARGDKAEEAKGKIKEEWGDATDNTRLEAEGKAEQVKAKADQVGDDAADALQNARDEAADTWEDAKDGGENSTLDAMGDKLRDLKNKVD